jgi:hypothetical protein
MKKKILGLVASVMCSFGMTLLFLALTLVFVQSSIAQTTENDDCSDGRCAVYYLIHCV